MADTIQRVEYFYAQVPNKAGEGSRFLGRQRNRACHLPGKWSSNVGHLRALRLHRHRKFSPDLPVVEVTLYRQFEGSWCLNKPKRSDAYRLRNLSRDAGDYRDRTGSRAVASTMLAAASA